MSGFDWAAINEADEQKKRLLLQMLERQRKRAQELQDEEDAQTEEADPFTLQAKLADPAYYQDQYAVEPTTAAEKAEQLLFDALSSGGAQAPSSAFGSSMYDKLGSLLSAYDQSEPT